MVTTLEYIPTLREIGYADARAEDKRTEELNALAELAYIDAGAGFDSLD